MLLDTTLSFIGSGAMVEAMISGILTRNSSSLLIMASGPRSAAARSSRERYGIRASRTTAAIAATSSS